VGNRASAPVSYSVQYASGGLCLGEPCHAVLQPINSDGSSVFKQGSTVPVKFRVCDANGNSIGTPGVVVSFKMVKKVKPPLIDKVNEPVSTAKPFDAFRWDPTSQQWIFNLSTRNLTAGWVYYYEIKLNDGTSIYFNFMIR